ncbi:uncharacterized protein LOC135692576 [Rhopilema esculentum]|uniref:uncharacterized protein LOC135692576 n=1 Tax=Rhopilema esculentum TaxID=499914 RepID=UPI0031DBD43A
MGFNKIDAYLWIRGQFKPVKIGFSFASRSDFTNPKFPWLPKLVLVVTRSIFALYTVAFAVASVLENGTAFLQQMPQFSQALGAIYFFVSAICTEVSFFRKIRRFSTHRETFFASHKRKLNKSPTLETISDAEQQLPFTSQTDIPERLIEASFQPVYKETTQVQETKLMNLFWYHKLQWILYDLAICLNFSFTAAALFYQENIFFSSSKGKLLRIHTYGVTTAFLLVDFLLNSVPVRVAHIIYPLALNTLYFIAVVIYNKSLNGTARLLPEVNCTGTDCLVQIAVILGAGSFAVHITLFMIKSLLDLGARHPAKKSSEPPQTSSRPTLRKISRASRNSDSTQMTSLDGYKTYASK